MSPEADLVSQEISSWRSGRPPDAARFLSAHPDVEAHKSLVLELAYEEYCLRNEAGEEIPPSTFCDRFSTYRCSLARLLDIHECLAKDADLSRKADQIEWPSLGTEFCGFVLISELGRGAFSRVYLATEPALGDRRVAIKLTWMGGDEAKTLGKLSHPNVVPVYSVQNDIQTGLSIVCMPYLGAATLSDLLETLEAEQLSTAQAEVVSRVGCSQDGDIEEQHSPWPNPRTYVEEVIQIGVQLAEALAYMHSHGVLHCDLKPSNVLLTPNGVPMLLDFNLSTDSAAVGSRVGGTLPYMSPEQIWAIFFSEKSAENANAASNPIDERSDIFSLGVVLYQLLTGKLPFRGSDDGLPSNETPKQLLELQNRGEKPVSSLNPAVDAKVDALVRRCLDRDALRRPQSAAELADDLRYFLSKKYRVRRWLHRHRLALTGVAAAMAILLISGIVWLVSRPPLSVRLYESGLASYEKGGYELAIEQFNEAAAADRKTAEILFARGMAKVMLGDTVEASTDFYAAGKLSKHETIQAMLAYCYSRRNAHPDAILVSQDLLTAGHISAPILINAGNSFYGLNLLPKAIEVLDQAIVMDDRRRQAFQIRALVHFRLALQGKQKINGALRDIERALALAPGNRDLLHHAARIFAFSARSNPEDKQKSLAYLEQAVAQGAPATDSLFDVFRGDELCEKRYAACLSNDSKVPLIPDPPVVLPVSSANLPSMAHVLAKK